MRIRPGVILAIVAMFAVLFIARYLTYSDKRPAEVAGNSDAAAPATETSTPDPIVPPPGPPLSSMPRALHPPTPTTTTAPAASPAGAPQLITDWEQRIDDVLTGKEDEPLKAKKLLEMLPNLPEEGQVEAAQHLSNLLPDEQYPALAQTLTNAHTAEPVLDVLMTDVLNRPNPIKLSTLLDIARTPDHPKSGEAKDVLEVFVDEDYGNNWVAWTDAIQKWLRENPDE